MTVDDFKHLNARHEGRIRRMIDECERLQRWDEFSRQYHVLARRHKRGEMEGLRLRLGRQMGMTPSETKIALFGR